MVRPRSLVLGPIRALRASGKLVVPCLVLLLTTATLHAGDLRIPLPKRSKYTPVQALNRDGVKAVEHHQFEKAKKLFYKAYLIDPNDPFTLNNLGYMAEIEGDSDRARRFYALSAELGSDAIIDRSNNEQLIGKPVSTVAGRAEDKGIKTTRLNNEAIALLEKDRAPEADLILQRALTIDSQNPFTLNNLGYAKEKEGEIEAAYQFYNAAASRNSQEKVEVAIDKDWRGRAISDVARDNARKLNRRMRDVNDVESRVALLNLRGVSALNRNDRRTGRDFIEKAFKLAPEDAFTLNNMGFLAEMDGDKETADFYYERAREANQKNARIAIATRKEVEGKRIGDVAEVTDQLVESRMEAARLERQRQGGPVLLMRRDNTAVVEPDKPAVEPKHERVSNENGELLLPPRPHDTMMTAPATTGAIGAPAGTATHAQPQPEIPSGGLAMPLPDEEQPTTVKEGDRDGGMIMPLPDDEQPGATQPPMPNTQPQQNEGQHDGGMIMPLPDDQQPGTQPSNPQAAPQQNEGQHNGGMIMPLPDDQQPGAHPQSQSTQPLPQTQPAPAVAAPPTATHTIITNPGTTNPAPSSGATPTTPATDTPAPAPAPTTAAPPASGNTQPATTGTAPAVTAPAAPAQQAPTQQNPPLLLPPPDKEQSNTGVYSPPPASSNPGGYTQAAPPQHISDTDTKKAQPKSNTTPPNSSAPNKISDQ